MLDTSVLAHGDGWRLQDVVCSAGRRERASVEQHDAYSIALVARGTFRYRTSTGAALLCPGAAMLGNVGECYECGHDHDGGDRCLSFHFTAGLLDEIASALRRARPDFARPALPTLLVPPALLADVEFARDAAHQDCEELVLRVAGHVLEVLSGDVAPASRFDRRSVVRIADAVRRIDETTDAPLSLAELARGAAMSRFGFLRTFAAVVGQTPHQYVLARRLHRAATGLLASDAPVARIAADAGFGDLSTFNHYFRRRIGATPTAWRVRHGR